MSLIECISDPLCSSLLGGSSMLLILACWALIVKERQLTRYAAKAKQKVQTLKNEHIEMHKVINAQMHGVVTIDLQGTIVFTNSAVQSLLGYSKEIVGHHIEEILDPDSLLAAGVQLGAEGALPRSHWDVSSIHRDGHLVPVELSALDYQLNGQPHRVLFLVDVAEQRAHEQRLETAIQQADAANRAKSAFLANISHEVRTPMAAIMGLADLCLQSDLTHRQRDQVSKLYSTAESLMGMLNDLLDLSKIEAGAVELEAIPLQLDDVLGEVATVVRQKAFDKDLELIFQRDLATPNHVIGDPLRLKQVLINLISNAIRFTDMGRVELTIRTEAATGRLHFSVFDTGCGMTPEQLENVMKPFVQADSSTSRVYGGTGLGLAISQRLLKLMDGELKIESAPGVGSHFCFSIPMAVNSADSGQWNDALKGLTALVIDDDPKQCWILENYLGSWGMQVSCTTSRVEVLELIDDTDPFDLVIHDQYMPDDIDIEKLVTTAGLDRVKQQNIIRLMNKPHPVPFENLIPTTDLMKPFSPSSLRDAVDLALGYGQQISASPDNGRESDYEGVKLLLAEDNPINQEIACDLLSQLGFVVRVAENGREAVSIFDSEHIDCVLMDIHMPEMDGYEAARIIRSLESGRTTPIIALTASAMMDTRQKVKDAGMNDVVEKPINRRKLNAVLADILKKQDEITDSASDKFADEPGTVPGTIDSCIGIANANNNESLYRKLLGDFRANHADDPQRINVLIDKGDTDGALPVAHTLKGIAGTLGMRRLNEIAREIEQGLSSGLDVAPRLPALKREMSAVCEELNSFHEEQASQSDEYEKPMDLASLRHLLEAFDPDSELVLMSMQSSLEQANVDSLDELKEHVSHYRFESALITLETIEAQLTGHHLPLADQLRGDQRID